MTPTNQDRPRSHPIARVGFPLILLLFVGMCAVGSKTADEPRRPVVTNDPHSLYKDETGNCKRQGQKLERMMDDPRYNARDLQAQARKTRAACGRAY